MRGRNSDNTLIRAQLGWEPSISLRTGMAATYRWIEQQVADRHLQPARHAAADAVAAE